MSLNKRLHDIFKSTSRLLVVRNTKKCTDHVKLWNHKLERTTTVDLFIFGILIISQCICRLFACFALILQRASPSCIRPSLLTRFQAYQTWSTGHSPIFFVVFQVPQHNRIRVGDGRLWEKRQVNRQAIRQNARCSNCNGWVDILPRFRLNLVIQTAYFACVW